MLYMDEEAKRLANDLFKYSYYVNGFGFGATSFIHLSPTMLKLAFPNYVENLNKLMSKEVDGVEIPGATFSEQTQQNFIDQ